MNLTQKAINKNTSLAEAKEIAEKLRIIYRNLEEEHGRKVQKYYREGDFSAALNENIISTSYGFLELDFLDITLCKRRSNGLIKHIKEEVKELEEQGVLIP